MLDIEIDSPLICLADRNTGGKLGLSFIAKLWLTIILGYVYCNLHDIYSTQYSQASL